MAIIKTVNWGGGSNAHYDLNAMTPEERTHFDSDGRPLFAGAPGDGPGQGPLHLSMTAPDNPGVPNIHPAVVSPYGPF